jgi:serine/threonine protein kinase
VIGLNPSINCNSKFVLSWMQEKIISRCSRIHSYGMKTLRNLPSTFDRCAKDLMASSKLLPLAFANIVDSSTSDKVFIFPKLDLLFSIGVPNTKDRHTQYLVKLKEAINKIHAARVIHVDLFPRNILWSLHGGCIDIRIVDWDAANFESESFSKTMEFQLSNTDHSAYYWYVNGR